MKIRVHDRRQQLWCDTGKHLIQQGEKFGYIENGALSCPDHQHLKTADMLPETMLAGALR